METVRRLRDAYPVQFVLNSDFEEGQAPSIACGIDRLQERGDDAAVIELGDMPAVSAETIDELIAAYERHQKKSSSRRMGTSEAIP